MTAHRAVRSSTPAEIAPYFFDERNPATISAIGSALMTGLRNPPLSVVRLGARRFAGYASWPGDERPLHRSETGDASSRANIARRVGNHRSDRPVDCRRYDDRLADKRRNKIGDPGDTSLP